MAGGAFNPQAFDAAAFSAQAFSTQEQAPGALAGTFYSSFSGTADLVLLARPVIVPPAAQDGGGRVREDARRRHFPAHQPAKEAARKRARRQADEELLLAF